MEEGQEVDIRKMAGMWGKEYGWVGGMEDGWR